MEFVNVKEALRYLVDLSQAKKIEVNGQLATTDQVQELFHETLVNVADLLGHEDVYLNK
ncbi:hypothetical protein [Carnobacterium maltaromaticum]|uniref:hypothetical protein n=1 Tax=Carnobacterium maltaromaticum TaxID=2751 RepID=UPI00165AC296|nr:hypothetical protein [Carnobacterium maltaromaticum]